MLYNFYEMNRAATSPAHAFARTQSSFLHAPWNPIRDLPGGRAMTAMVDVIESITRVYGKPQWNLPVTEIGDMQVAVEAKLAWRDVWCDLLHFERDPAQLAEARARRGQSVDHQDPVLLICAPLSGHYATLLRGTVSAFLPDHEVYVTDWADARMRPLWEGRFGLDDYVSYIREILTFLGPQAHVVGVCQPGPPVLAAIALMSEDGDPNLPATMTFMGSPIDTRRSPTVPNLLAKEKSFGWFESNMVHTTPPLYPGALRRVYPGFVQLASFMNMNWERHVDAHWEFFNHLVEGDGDNAAKHREFYDEYLAVLDLTEEFYLETILRIFQEDHLATDRFMWKGRKVDVRAITDVALMTVEGERDDISGIGQTQAAHDLCLNIPAHMRIDHVQKEVGHYGVFNGRRFLQEIAPRMKRFFREHEKGRRGNVVPLAGRKNRTAS